MGGNEDEEADEEDEEEAEERVEIEVVSDIDNWLDALSISPVVHKPSV